MERHRGACPQDNPVDKPADKQNRSGIGDDHRKKGVQLEYPNPCVWNKDQDKDSNKG
jgi:hypothetical protein